jgi:hypothetical protein
LSVTIQEQGVNGLGVALNIKRVGESFTVKPEYVTTATGVVLAWYW